MKQRIDGGYLILREPFIRAGMHAHTKALDAPVSADVVDGVNLVQRTPWRINRFVYDVLSRAWEAGDQIGGMPPAYDTPLPARMDDEQWAKLTPREIVTHKLKLAAVHAANAKAQGAREEMLRKLQVANDMVERERFWHAWSVDFRYRMYPITQDLHPQGDDMARALHTFADGVPLGSAGHIWIAAQLGAAYGNGVDKMSIADRLAWVRDHEAAIRDSVKDPLDGRRWWADAEEPWSCLAACEEWVMNLEYRDRHVSHLPVQVDGSCNGLQHLAAMARDPVGAAAVNMARGTTRQDVYSEVAAVANTIIERDCATGLAEALAWKGKVSRSTVKRAVMTTPYGVTPRGMRDQFISDGHTKAAKLESEVAAANYLRDVVGEAIGTTVASARQVMGYLQGCAIALARAGIPFDWTLPDGAQVRQAYWRRAPTRIYTQWGNIRLWDEVPNDELAIRKQELAAAPQFVHSYDALHLRRTVLALSRIVEHPALSMIHDSYGTHAAHMDTMTRVLRHEFVRIYEQDVLANLDRTLRSAHPNITFPDLPERGSFDVGEVRHAPFFFS